MAEPIETPTLLAGGGRDLALLIARLCMSSLFLFSGLEKATHLRQAAGFATRFGVPFAFQLMPLAAAFEIAAAVMIILGWRARLAGWALALWMLVLGPWFHPFWAVPANMWQPMIDSFFHHFVMIGGMMFLGIWGPGRLALDRR